MDVFVARQPIFDHRKRVFGYELLFRSGPENYFTGTDPDQASSSLIESSMNVFGLQDLIGSKKAFINLTRRLIVDELATVLPRERTVLEVLETIEPDDEVVEACRKLKEQGYTIALDDFVYNPAFDSLLQHAKIIKVDFIESQEKARRLFAKTFLPRGIKLLAEKVETYGEFQQAVDLGYSYFQGYFFCKPEVMTGKTISASKENYLIFLQELSKPEIDFDQLEGVIKRDVSLSIRLLRLLNSAAIGLRTKITSIKHALVLLGERPLKKWAMLLTFANLAADKPSELIVTCLSRANFCEKVGEQSANANSIDLFFLGMLSGLDAVMNAPLEQLLERISISEVVRNTLLGKQTEFSKIHQMVSAYETADWQTISRLASELGIEEDKIAKIYLESIEWAEQIARM